MPWYPFKFFTFSPAWFQNIVKADWLWARFSTFASTLGYIWLMLWELKVFGVMRFIKHEEGEFQGQKALRRGPSILSSEYTPKPLTFAKFTRMPTSYSLKPKPRSQKVKWKPKDIPNLLQPSVGFKFALGMGMMAKKNVRGLRSPKRAPRKIWERCWSSISARPWSLSSGLIINELTSSVTQPACITKQRHTLSKIRSLIAALMWHIGGKSQPRKSRCRKNARVPPEIRRNKIRILDEQAR